MTLTTLVLIITGLFWLMILYNVVLAIAGLVHRSRPLDLHAPSAWPSVDVLIPAYNEGKVLFGTLDAMAQLDYPGALNVYLLDDNSTDTTAAIADYFAARLATIHHVLVPKGLPKGKARVLNYGFHNSTGDMVVVYDADNQPRPDAVTLLVEKTLESDRYAGAVGTVRTINMYSNALTRMIGLEFMMFQLLMQSGRWQLFKLGTYTGTDMLARRSVLDDIGGWDEHALAEDTELSMRIVSKGLQIPVVAASVTYEQEPENLKAWFRQRSRWLQGNLYTVSKTLHDPHLRGGANTFSILQMLSVYYIFILLLLVSDVWFVMGLIGRFTTPSPAPLLILWFETIWIYAAQISLATVSEHEASAKNVLFALLMYFTYSQLWIYLVLRGYVLQVAGIFKKAEPVWDKTPRF